MKYSLLDDSVAASCVGPTIGGISFGFVRSVQITGDLFVLLARLSFA
jgi:hypothetical protein